jgi:hypothetical protein
MTPFEVLRKIGDIMVNFDQYFVAILICVALLWFKPTRYVILLSAFVWILI